MAEQDDVPVAADITNSIKKAPEHRHREWQGQAQRVRWLVLTPLLLFTLCASAPQTEVKVGMGYSDEVVPTGCSAYRVRSAPVYGLVSHTYQNNVSLTAEGSMGNLLDSTGMSGNVAFRLGYSHEYFGAQLGPTLLFNPYVNHSAFPFVSADVWVGKRELLYAWGRVMSGPYTPNSFWNLGKVGIGHRTQEYEFELGVPLEYAGDASAWPLIEATGAFRVSPEFWVGGQVGYGQGVDQPKNMQFFLTVGYRPQQKREEGAREGRQP